MKQQLLRFLHHVSFVFKKRKSRTVRFAFPLVLTTFSLIGASLLLPTDASYIRIETNADTIAPGDTFTVDVYAGAHIPVNAVNIEVAYPSDTTEVIGIDTGKSVITIWTQDPYVDGNHVVFSGGTFRKGFLGEHLIGSINLRAKQEGSYTFKAEDIKLFAGDGTGDAVAVGASGEEETVVRVTTDAGSLSAEVEIVTLVDINGDGQVTMTDIIEFMSAWRNKDRAYDFNGDNRMTFRDFGIILAKSVLE